MPPSKDAIKHARREDPAEFKSEIEAILADKITDALELKKMEVASNFLNSPETEEDATQEIQPEMEETEDVE